MSVTKYTNFEIVCLMNSAFGNSQGAPHSFPIEKLRSQCKNILDEYGELMIALGATHPQWLREMINLIKINTKFDAGINIDDTRDALCDIHVFAYGAHHIMGIDADADMNSVVSAVMTRFIKDEADKAATIAYHASKGVVDVYFEGEYPKMIMKSASDQPDAPKGKFLKSASYRQPTFYKV